MLKQQLRDLRLLLRNYLRILVDPRAIRNFWTSLAVVCGLKKSTRKVFAIGMNKTGTSSIHQVFIQAGMVAIHSSAWPRPIHRLLLMANEGFSDGHALKFHIFDRMFPGSKFILNVRDLDSWLDSRIHHVDYLIDRYGGARLNRLWGRSDEAVVNSILLRNMHHLAVLNYFADRPEDLLVLNFIRDPDAVGKIADFIGADIDIEKPHVHPIPMLRDSSDLKAKDQIIRAFKKLNVPESEWRNDLFCPSLVNDPADLKWGPDTDFRYH